MPDKQFPVGEGSTVQEWRDMGDGTHAPTVSAVTPAITETNRSGTVAAGGVAQSLAPANTARKAFMVQNLSSADLYIRAGADASAGAGSIKIPAGGVWEYAPNAVPTAAISIFGATTGQAFTALEGS